VVQAKVIRGVRVEPIIRLWWWYNFFVNVVNIAVVAVVISYSSMIERSSILNIIVFVCYSD
jgi:hypothetical protein